MVDFWIGLWSNGGILYFFIMFVPIFLGVIGGIIGWKLVERLWNWYFEKPTEKD